MSGLIGKGKGLHHAFESASTTSQGTTDFNHDYQSSRNDQSWLRQWECSVPHTLRRPPSLWLPYSSFPMGSIRRICDPLLSHLSSQWQLVWDGCFGWPIYTAHKRTLYQRLHNVSYATLALATLMLCFWFVMHSAVLMGSLCVFSLISTFWFWDLIWLTYFWVASMMDSFSQFNDIVCRSLKPLPPSQEPWKYQSDTLDKLFDYFILMLENCQHWSVGASIPWRYFESSALFRDFRLFLGANPPPQPVAAHDYPFLQDSNVNPSQIVALAITERMSLEVLRQVTFSRWVVKELKLRSVLGVKWGRPCWIPQTCHPPNSVFSISSHVDEELLDLSATNIYEAVSEMASKCLPRDKPLWRIQLFQPCNGVIQVEPNLSLPADKVSYVCIQIHHSIADGTGIAYSICTKLFDPACETGLRSRLDCSTANGETANQSDSALVSKSATYKPPSYVQVVLYYAFYFLKSLWYAFGTMLFWFFVAPLPCAVFDPVIPNSPAIRLRSPPTGRKYLLPPESVPESRVRRICDRIHQLVGHKPTINDLYIYCITRVLLPRSKSIMADTSSSPSSRLDESAVRDIIAQYENLYVHKFASHWLDYLQCMIPMSARTSFPTSMDNFTSFVVVRLPGDRLVNDEKSCQVRSITQEVACRLRHLFAVKGEMDWLKAVNGRTMFFTSVCAVFKLFPDVVTRCIGSRVNNACRVCFTNVVGPTEIGFLGGRRVFAVQSWPPVRDALTTGIKLLSYRSQLQLLVLMDEIEAAVPARLKGDPSPNRRKLFRNARRLGQDIMNEMFVLENLLGLASKGEE